MSMSLIFLFFVLCSLAVGWKYERTYQRLKEMLPERARIHAIREVLRDDSTWYQFEIELIDQPGSPIRELLHAFAHRRWDFGRQRWLLGDLIYVVPYGGENFYVPQQDLWQIRIGIAISLATGVVFGILAYLDWGELFRVIP